MRDVILKASPESRYSLVFSAMYLRGNDGTTQCSRMAMARIDHTSIAVSLTRENLRDLREWIDGELGYEH